MLPFPLPPKTLACCLLLFLQFIKLKALPIVTLEDVMQIGRIRLIYGGNEFNVITIFMSVEKDKGF